MTVLNTADKLYVGTSVVDKVYLGATELWVPVLGITTPESGLTVNRTANQLDALSATWFARTSDGLFAVDVVTTASPDGVVFEIGGTGSGMACVFNGGNFVFRFGDGGSLTPADAPRVVVTPAEFDFTSWTGTIVCEIDWTNSTATAFFDTGSTGIIDFWKSDDKASATAQWAGTNSGAVGQWANTSIAGSETTVNFNGTISQFRYYSPYTAGTWV